MSQNQAPEVIHGRNNVFEDLGFAPEEALNLKIRADLMLNIKHFIQTKDGLKASCSVFGETQPRISDLMNGDIERFSIDKLVVMLAQAGMDVRLEVGVKAA
ncbi:MAG: XRE family transcriptional regulator [Pseudanabaena sp. CRU_2_10]|nr:XRE family transcriptional regulator [Pseudanabaena sp. CRU_2_10]